MLQFLFNLQLPLTRKPWVTLAIKWEVNILLKSSCVFIIASLWYGTWEYDMESVKFLFIAITPRSTLTQSDNISSNYIYRSNRNVSLETWYHIIVYKLFVLRIITWSYNPVDYFDICPSHTSWRWRLCSFLFLPEIYNLSVIPSVANRDILNRTLYCIWWWDSTSGALESVKYLFNAITLKSTLNCKDYLCLSFPLF